MPESLRIACYVPLVVFAAGYSGYYIWLNKGSEWLWIAQGAAVGAIASSIFFGIIETFIEKAFGTEETVRAAGVFSYRNPASEYDERGLPRYGTGTNSTGTGATGTNATGTGTTGTGAK